MKRIQYRFCSGRINRGTEESPAYEDVLLNVSMPWSEANEEIAKKEALGGEYTVSDDGQQEMPTLEDRVGTLESDSAETREALELLLSGVTE